METAGEQGSWQQRRKCAEERREKSEEGRMEEWNIYLCVYAVCEKRKHEGKNS